MYIHHILSESSTDGHLGWFRVSTTVNSAAVNAAVHETFHIIEFLSFLDIYPGAGLLESHGSSVFSFLSNLHAVFHRDCTNLHFIWDVLLQQIWSRTQEPTHTKNYSCCHRALALGSLCHTANSHWLSILHLVMYMFQYYSLKSSHHLPLPL